MWRGSPGAGKAREARAAGADAPGRQRDAEGRDLRRDRLESRRARELTRQMGVILGERAASVVFGDEVGGCGCVMGPRADAKLSVTAQVDGFAGPRIASWLDRFAALARTVGSWRAQRVKDCDVAGVDVEDVAGRFGRGSLAKK